MKISTFGNTETDLQESKISRTSKKRSAEMEAEEDYFWRKPTEYRSYYHMRIYGYIDLICFVIVLVSNMSVIIVLTRKNMKSPINMLFTNYILTELVSGFCYLPRAWHEYFRVDLCSIPQHRTYTWEMISLHSYAAAIVFRHIGVWLGLMIAVWRYIAVVHPLKERYLCSIRITRIWILAGYIIVGIVSTSHYFCVDVGPAVKLLDQNGCSTTNYAIGKNITIYEFQVPIENYPMLYTIGFFIFGLFVKILPSVVLAAISFKLVVSLIKLGTHRKEMATTSNNSNAYNSKVKRKIAQETDRTTIIVLVILILFIIGEVPHGIFSMFTIYYGPKFFWKYYYFAMEILNSLTFISECFNFVIYYTLSKQFRNTFKSLFNNNPNRIKTVTPQTSSSSLPGTKKVPDDSSRSPNIATSSYTCA